MSWHTILVEAVASGIFSALLVGVFALGGHALRKVTYGWLGSLNKLPNVILVWLQGTILLTLLFVIGDIVALAGFFAFKQIVKQIVEHFPKLTPLETHITVGFVVIGFGLLIYAIKKENQLLYGIVELVFAFVAGVQTASQMVLTAAPAQEATHLLALGGAVYVVSRGLNNIDEAIAKKKKNQPNEIAA
jgi:hypothetical protein